MSGWMLLSATLAGASSALGQGIIVPSAGPINSALGGASKAAPVDSGGSDWNPRAVPAGTGGTVP